MGRRPVILSYALKEGVEGDLCNSLREAEERVQGWNMRSYTFSAEVCNQYSRGGYQGIRASYCKG